MKDEKEKALIVVKQLPIIEEQLKGLSVVIDEKVANALSLVVNDDTVKEVKTVRADLNKDFKVLEDQRKMVKEKVLKPYQEFEDIYKTYVSEKFKKANSELKDKIDEVEAEQKRIKAEEVSEYYTEYAVSQDLEWICTDLYYNMANINVTLSASMKSLKEQAKAFIDKVKDDLALIDTQEHKVEILVEYKRSLNVSNAITTITDRFQKEEDEKKRLEELKARQEEQAKVVEKVEAVATPVMAPVVETPQEKVKLYNMSFKVVGTLEELKGVKEYLEKAGVKYERI
jgi:hypothetical protein|uniref:DUF1351 domain-containing protein n=1 Tax=Siphoviridae sp. ctqwY3 TaxID=2827951 RepID=A0A8S5S701_9CAUD|nr:MAG TPA: Protein of unknown function (DUF1351) [Siphoviridae sp. ctqwY3]